MRVFGLCGRKGGGKTTLLIKLIPWLKGRGLTISTIMEAHAAFDVDRPGKDSYEHRAAGAREVVLASSKRWALMHEAAAATPPELEELTARMTKVDLVLAEGFGHWPTSRIEVWRQGLGEPIFAADPRIVAVAADGPVPGLDRPLLDLNDIDALGRFILKETGL
jgi:molybdopterin-guanine dinucleotide biosynthesis protein B